MCHAGGILIEDKWYRKENWGRVREVDREN